MQTIALDKNDFYRIQVGLRLGNAKINFISFCYSTRLNFDRVQVGLRLGNAKINFISFCYSTRLALTLRKE